MFSLFFYIQISFCVQGYGRRDPILFWSLGASALVSLSIILRVTQLRHL
jgi:hypothetical protein